MPADPQQLTPWFKDRQPWVPGVYQQLCGDGKDIGYQYWDGSFWYPWRHTPEDAEAAFVTRREHSPDWCIASTQNDPWRGLTKEQK